MNVQRILFPTDFSELSKAAENSAYNMADQFEAELHVFGEFLMMPRTAAAVMIPPKVMEDVINSTEEVIQSVPPVTWASGKEVMRVVRRVRRSTPLCNTPRTTRSI